MGIYGAMATAISGLKAQSFALEHVSGNIANTRTTGYKRLETSFQDFVPSSPVSAQKIGGVRAMSRATNDVQGDLQNADLQNADLQTFMGINGDGFFVVSKPDSFADGQPVFSGPDLYTRRGNLAEFPLTASADTATPGSELLTTADLPSAPADLSVIIATDETAFLDNSIAGGAITIYEQGGAPVNVQMRWSQTSNAPDTWNAFYLTDSAATGGATKWVNIGTDYTFDATGNLTSPTSVNLASVTVDGVTIPNVLLDHGNGLTQFSDPSGTLQITEMTQNGSPASKLVSVQVTDAGRLAASYTNGRTIDLYEMQLANFNAPNKLQRLDGGAMAVTTESGPAIFGAAGDIVGATLESSNTDIADEFTKLIVTQQAYAAGTRIVSTSDEMLQEALNMVR